MLSAALAFGAKIFGAIGKFFDWRENRAHESMGRNQEKLRQSETAREASQEMREIENAIAGLNPDARRELARKWVQRSAVGGGDSG